MGIESDQLVFDYLSRVGDLAQQQLLPSGARMRLVAELRAEIDSRRSAGGDSPAAVKRILGKLGSPDEVVAAASGGAADAGEPVASAGAAKTPVNPQPGVPLQKSRKSQKSQPSQKSQKSQPSQKSGLVPAPRQQPAGPTPPHLAGEDELGRAEADLGPDWWRIEPLPEAGGQTVPGFVGGIELPEVLMPPPRDPGPLEKRATPAAEEGEEAARPGVVRRLLAKRKGATAAAGAHAGDTGATDTSRGTGGGRRLPANPLLMLAAVLLVAGAALGSWLALGFGWVLAYGTRRLSRVEAKWAALGVPGLVASGALVWLWGRMDGRWGDAIPRGHLGDVIAGTWPVVVRTAAVASALFLVWRARRQPRG